LQSKNVQFEEMTKACEACVQEPPSRAVEPFIEPEANMVEISTKEKVCIDLFHYRGQEHLLLVNRCSGYSMTTTAEKTKQLSPLFHNFGFPRKLK
jgi:hypothetical protein